jgi:hypothetical protein
VSNHTPQHLTTLMQRTDVVPAVNQVEVHPHFTQRELREFDAQHALVTQSWSPLGGVNRYWAGNPNAGKDPLQEPVITQLAAKYGKTPAQVILRWHIEHGLCDPEVRQGAPHRREHQHLRLRADPAGGGRHRRARLRRAQRPQTPTTYGGTPSADTSATGGQCAPWRGQPSVYGPRQRCGAALGAYWAWTTANCH